MTIGTIKRVCSHCGAGCGIVMEVAGKRVLKLMGKPVISGAPMRQR
ncbi:hypothetical protein [Candidatus Methylobacter oryzae]|uniref:4Fe-4S Mo/W bis-MGD-type domain-containing protein n=1 Tax=Candidatus Methylobacter oryzae TaxID=2497749 RepID=A0ABY3C4Z4_9GAMM|nr:hypothetical protein EKO24_021325 [Candidatus Methylobacter oryzae]